MAIHSLFDVCSMPVLMHQVCGHDRQPCGLGVGRRLRQGSLVTCPGLAGLPGFRTVSFSASRWLDLIGVSSSRFVVSLQTHHSVVLPSRVNPYIPMSTSLHLSPSLTLTGFGLQLARCKRETQHYQYANTLAAATGRTTSLPNRSVSGCFPFLWGNLSGS